MSIVVFIFLFLTCLFSALFLPVPFWWVLDAGRVLLVWSSGGLLLVWVQLHHSTVEKSLDAPQPGCTVYTITFDTFFKPDWYRGAHFTASIHVYVALPCHFRCSCVVWVLCSFSLSVVRCAVWDASGVWRNGQLLLLQEDGRHHPSSSPSHFIIRWNILSAVHNHWKWPLKINLQRCKDA